MAKKEKSTNVRNEIIQKAVNAGFYSLISQPGMRNYETPLRKNLDIKKIYSVVDQIEKEIINKKIKGNEQSEFLYKNLASFISSGDALKDEWKKILMEKTHSGKLKQNILEKIVSFLKPNKFKGEEYLKKAENAYGTMYDLLLQNETAQQEIPSLVKAAKALKMYGFLDAALETFKASGMMEAKTYNKLSKINYQTAAEGAQEGIKGIEGYILSRREKNPEKGYSKIEKYLPNAEKAVASIIGVVGAAIVLFSSGITGAVIGDSKITGGIGGLVLMAISVFMFILSSKRKYKR